MNENEINSQQVGEAAAPSKKAARTAREAKQQKEQRRSNLLYALIGIVFVAVAAIVLVWKTGYIQSNQTAAIVNGEKRTAAEVQYYYSSNVQNFINQNYYYLSYIGLNTNASMRDQVYALDDSGMTWFDYFADQTLLQMSHLQRIAQKAEAAGYTWDDKLQASFDDAMAQLNSSVTSYNMAQGTNLSTKDYIKQMYGSLVTQEILEKQLRTSLMAQAYANDFAESLEYSSADYENEYKANRNSYDLVDYESIRINGSAPATTNADGSTTAPTDEQKAAALADAKKLAESIYADFKAGKALSTLADDERASYSDNAASAYYTSTLLDWVFDSARKPGDSAMLFDESTSTYFVASFANRYRDEVNSVNVRHILVTPAEGTKVEGEEGYEAEQTQLWADAKAKADALLKEWQSGAATEDAFAQLANEHSEDPGSNTVGGLYTQVIPGMMVPAFNDWCFDSSRHVGDTDVVETDYGYHVMYFSGKDMPGWQLAVKNVLLNNDCSAWYTEMTKDATYEAVAAGMAYVD